MLFTGHHRSVYTEKNLALGLECTDHGQRLWSGAHALKTLVYKRTSHLVN